jgi:hypothetical protein
MALVTTFMTGPSLSVIDRIFRTGSAGPAAEPERKSYRILVSFADPDGARALMKVAHVLARHDPERSLVTAMHLGDSSELHRYNLETYERQSFTPIEDEAALLHQPMTTFFKSSSNIDHDILDTADRGGFDILLVGMGRSIYQGTLLGRVLGFTTRIIDPTTLINTMTGREPLFANSAFDDRTRSLMSRATVPVGVLLYKGLEKIDRIVVLIARPEDRYLLAYARRVSNGRRRTTVIDISVKGAQFAMTEVDRATIEFADGKDLNGSFFSGFDLMIVGRESWKGMVEAKAAWLAESPSVLVISEK